ncbi:hypothetical protein [Paraburkholderia jirisanensis]
MAEMSQGCADSGRPHWGIRRRDPVTGGGALKRALIKPTLQSVAHRLALEALPAPHHFSLTQGFSRLQKNRERLRFFQLTSSQIPSPR